MLLTVLKWIAAAGTALTGLVLTVRPQVVTNFTGVEALSKRGMTEIRAIFGGLFIGLGLAPLIFNSPEMYLLLGYAYLAAAVVRAIGIVIDRSGNGTNYITLLVEAAFGIVLVL
jgi:hypothetical protein